MEYLSCDCERCKNGIEFPAHGIGRRISCPHCGAPVTLKDGGSALAAPVPSKPSARVGAPASQAPANSISEPKVLPKSAPAPVQAQPPKSTDFDEKAKKWREERTQWLFTEAQANLPLIRQAKMDKATARKLRDLFQEISDEFERKAAEAETAKSSGRPPMI